ncbi:MAG: hypothetical protein ACI4JM_13305, partial [Oscillospiraceae bacterium]
ALPLETASFLKKAGQKLLVSPLCFIDAFFILPNRLDKANTKNRKRQLAAKLDPNFYLLVVELTLI